MKMSKWGLSDQHWQSGNTNCILCLSSLVGYMAVPNLVPRNQVTTAAPVAIQSLLLCIILLLNDQNTSPALMLK